MARRFKSKRRLKLEERFKAGVIAYLATLGARPGCFYDHELDTPAGVLYVTPYGDWIACRFDDVSLGRLFTCYHGPACNPWQRQVEFQLRVFDGVRARSSLR